MDYQRLTLIERGNQAYHDLMILIQTTEHLPFLYQGRDHNHRDVLYHLYAWHHILLDLYHHNPNSPIELRKGYSWANLEALNYALLDEGKVFTLAEMKELIAKSHQQVIDLLKNISELDLNQPKKYPFTGESVLGEFFDECLALHYAWAMRTIGFQLGDPTLRELFHKLSERPEIDALVLGGSRGKNKGDQWSDYDIYVYLNTPIPVEDRKTLLDPYMSLMEYNHQFFETEDDGVLKNGIGIEFIYRSLADFKALIERNLSLQLNRGYSTCFIDNLLTSKIIFDREAKYEALQTKVRLADKKAIYRKVIEQNVPLLYGTQPALFDQIVKARKRNDVVAINHRLTEYLSLFFDTLFAINQVNHPGEKRMLELSEHLWIKPKGMKQTIERVLKEQASNESLIELEDLTKALIDLSKTL